MKVNIGIPNDFHSNMTPPPWKSRLNRLFLITGVFALFLILCTAPAVADTHEHNHGIAEDWTPISSEDDLRGITESGNYYLSEDIDLTEDAWAIPSGETINFCLNSHVIRQTVSEKAVIIIGYGSTLNLYDCGDTIHYFDIDSDGLWIYKESGIYEDYVIGGVITGCRVSRGSPTGGVYCTGTFKMYGGNIVGNSGSSVGGVYVDEGSVEFIMTGGKITGNIGTDSSNAGGVYMYYESSNFIMTGGEITRNIGSGTYTSGGIYCGAGNVFISGDAKIAYNKGTIAGGMYFQGGEFMMSGGEITRNTATGSDSAGGVFKVSGKFTMSGGDITYNTAYDEGGGVNNEWGQFIMTGGNITHNTGQRGGGVSNLDGTFIMYGGNISKNTGTVEGGGVFNLRESFEMRGGNITENKAPYGGGVYDDGYFNMYGGNITANTANMGGGVGSIYDKNGEGAGRPFIMHNGNITDNIAKSGGGVHYDGPEFKMYNGNITGNKATGFEDKVEYVGGGVFVSKGNSGETGGAFTMLGGNITDNIATDNYEDNFFGGVYSDGMITLSGKITITGNKVNGVVENLFLLEDETITIGEGGLLPGSSIGVTTEIKPEEDSPVYVTETTVFAESNTEYFHADKSTEEIQFDEDNYKIVLTKKPTPPPVPTLPGNGDLNVTYDNTQRYTVVIPGDMDFAGRLTIDNDARVIEMWLEINSVLNVSVKSENGFEMIHGDPAISRIPYEMSVDGGEPLEGTGFNVIMSVPANTPKDIDLGYFVKKDLWYEVTQSDIDAAKFAGEHKDTLTFKVEVEVASA